MQPFEWAIVRVVPRVERGELVNAGAIVYCQQLDFLRAAMDFAPDRALALDPALDVEEVTRHLRAIEDLCAGRPAAGANGRRPRGERFRWLTAPRSTVVQCSAIHTGVTTDPQGELDRLVATMVAPPG